MYGNKLSSISLCAPTLQVSSHAKGSFGFYTQFAILLPMLHGHVSNHGATTHVQQIRADPGCVCTYLSTSLGKTEGKSLLCFSPTPRVVRALPGEQKTWVSRPTFSTQEVLNLHRFFAQHSTHRPTSETLCQPFSSPRRISHLLVTAFCPPEMCDPYVPSVCTSAGTHLPSSCAAC